MTPPAPLSFTMPDGTRRTVTVKRLLNAGYAGRSQEDVAAHVAELAELGVPAPSTTPALYPVSPYLAQQTGTVLVQHGKTSGEAEWALVVDDTGELLLTAACDHTDRELETYGVAWSKNAAPDVLATSAWRLADVADRLDGLTLRAWVTGGGAGTGGGTGATAHPGTEELIQDGTAADLLTPHHWAEVLRERGELEPGTVLISGTIPMLQGVDQFAARWRVQLADPATGHEISLAYDVLPMPEPIG
jgi:2-keto-4-pentenoate hydratase/2-oxohepta-3-ene-1,7-dioic acid hydratase in catechol pathway